MKTSLRIATGAAALLAMAMLGCDEVPEPERHGAHVTDSAGVSLVHNRGAGLLPDLDTAALAEELRLSPVAAVAALATDAENRFFLLHAGSGSVSVLAADGSPLWEASPEYPAAARPLRPSRLLLGGTRMLIQDDAAGRAFIFDAAGRLRVAWTTTTPDGLRLDPLGHGPDGWLFRLSRSAPQPQRIPDPVVQLTARLGWLNETDLAQFAEWDATSLATLFRPVVSYATGRRFTLPEQTGAGHVVPRMRVRPLFEPIPADAMDAAGRIHVSAGFPYRVHVFDAAGTLIRRITREQPVRPVTTADIAEFSRRLAAHLERLGLPADDPQRLLLESRALAPSFHSMPVLGRLVVSRDGSIWAQRIDGPDPVHRELTGLERSLRPVTWDTFDENGYYLRSIELPTEFTLYFVDRRSATGLVRDQQGGEFVVRFLLPEG